MVYDADKKANGKDLPQIAAEFSVEKSTLAEWLKSRENIEKYSHPNRKHSAVNARFDMIEETIVRFLKLALDRS